MIIPRHITPHLERIAAQFPVVTVLGPRQSGKTTLVRTVFPGYEYLNLELPSLRLEAQSDALGFFRAHPPPLILDEIQHVPELIRRSRRGISSLRGRINPGLRRAFRSHLPVARGY